MKLIEIYKKKQNSDQLSTEEVQSYVEKAQLSLDKQIISNKEEINRHEMELNKYLKPNSFNASMIIKIREDIDGLKEGIKKLEELKEELF